MIGTPFGASPWDGQDVRDATGICETRTSAKLRDFERQLATLLRGLRALMPDETVHNLAQIATAAMFTGGGLARLGRFGRDRRGRPVARGLLCRRAAEILRQIDGGDDDDQDQKILPDGR